MLRWQPGRGSLSCHLRFPCMSGLESRKMPGDEALSSGQCLEWLTEPREAVLLVLPKPKSIHLVRSGIVLSRVKAPSPLKVSYPLVCFRPLASWRTATVWFFDRGTSNRSGYINDGFRCTRTGRDADEPGQVRSGLCVSRSIRWVFSVLVPRQWYCGLQHRGWCIA